MRFFNVLLHLYPVSFRNEYGGEIRAIFARRRRDASNPFAILALWIGVITETLFNAAAVHWDLLRQDLRYSLRTLWNARGFAFTAVAVVALGIGANTAAFTVTDFVLIRPLPFPQPERLVKIWERTPGYARMEPSPANYRDWKRLAKSYDAMGAFFTIEKNLVGKDEPRRIGTAAVSPILLRALSVQPLAGRTFTDAEDERGALGAAILSYRLWQTEFGGDGSIIGRRIILDDTPYLVIGIMPREFYFPDRDVQLWTTMRLPEVVYQDRNDNFFEVVARLKAGVTLDQARAELDLISSQLRKQYPKENEHSDVIAFPLRDEISQKSRLLLLALCGAAICVLLIACANLANLLLARALVRRKELAVRAALGAGRERLVRQLVTESMVLAILGGICGVLLAIAAVPLLTRLVPLALPIAETPAIDLRVMLFAAALTIATGLVFGVLPALRACGDSSTANGLREGSRSGGGRKERLRSALVIAEVAVSVVLLISAGLLMRALWRLQGTDPGFSSDNVMTMRMALPMPKYQATARRSAFYDQVLPNVRRLPGVTDAAYISFLPMAFGGGIFPVSVDGHLQQFRSESEVASLRFVTPGYFATLRIPLLMGRDVAESDTADRPNVAVVSKSFVQRYWPDQNPIGRHFQSAFGDWTVAGVVGDVRVRGFEQSSEPQVYLPYKQAKDGMFVFYAPKDLVVHYGGSSASLLPAIRAIVAKADPQQPISDVRPLSALLDDQTASRSAQVRVLAVFAAIAFLLAGVGIHGVLAFAVSQRSREIGVRIALGAKSADILRMVTRNGVLLVGAGLVPGLAIAYVAGRGLNALLAGVQPADTVTFAAATGLCILMTMLGCLLPALRAVRVDPITAMRVE